MSSNDEEYVNSLSLQLRNKLKEALGLSDDEFDEAWDEGRIYPVSYTHGLPKDSEDMIIEHAYTWLCPKIPERG